MKVTGKEFNVVIAEARRGEPARLVAYASLARKELKWKPIFSSLDKIVDHAWLREKIG